MSAIIVFLEALFLLAALASIPLVVGYLVYRKSALRARGNSLSLPEIHSFQEQTQRRVKQLIGGGAFSLILTISLTAMPFDIYSRYASDDYRYCVPDKEPLASAKIKWNNFRGTEALAHCVYLVARELHNIENTRAWLLNNGYKVAPLREVSQTIMFVNFQEPAPGWSQAAGRGTDQLKVRLHPTARFLAHGITIGVMFSKDERPVRTSAVLTYL